MDTISLSFWVLWMLTKMAAKIAAARPFTLVDILTTVIWHHIFALLLSISRPIKIEYDFCLMNAHQNCRGLSLSTLGHYNWTSHLSPDCFQIQHSFISLIWVLFCTVRWVPAGTLVTQMATKMAVSCSSPLLVTIAIHIVHYCSGFSL